MAAEIDYLDWFESPATQSLLKILEGRIKDLDSKWASSIDKPQVIAKLAGMKEAYENMVNDLKEVKESGSK
jgi:hypothetical protein